MACCAGTVSWYHCYPEACPSSDHCCCDYPCGGCCNGACAGSVQGTKPCNGPCTATCGKGSCCTCNQNESGFAWVSSAASCFWNIACGQRLWFRSAAPDPCGIQASGTRRDYNGTSTRLADLSPALFAALGHDPLREGIFDAIVSDVGFNSCPC